MAHAKQEHLEKHEDLVDLLREVDGLIEKPYARFYRKSKSVVHFHVSGERLYAHVWDGSDWQEVDLAPKPTATTTKKTFATISRLLQTK